MTAAEALRDATRKLTDAGIGSAATDARWLLGNVLTGEASAVLDPQRQLTAPEAARFADAISQRTHHRPVAQIIGEREFWGRKIRVTEATLDPRPETELIVETVLSADRKPSRILDIGTGTGCLVLTLLAECPDATGDGVDISPDALAVARENAARIGVADRCALYASDWLGQVSGDFDTIVSNPPYIPEADWMGLSADVKDWEPRCALTPGMDGLLPYRVYADQIHRFLTPDGQAVFEFGIGQGDAIDAIFAAAKRYRTERLNDLSGRSRVIVVRNA